MIREENLEIVGISTAITSACIAIIKARELANVYVANAALDYIELPVIGRLEAIFVALSRRPPAKTTEAMIQELDAPLNVTFTPLGQAIAVPRQEKAERILTITLSKLRHFGKVKVMAAGAAIGSAVSVALWTSKSGIAKETIGIEYVGLTSVASKLQPESSVPALAIYLTKGLETRIDSVHDEVRGKLTER